MTASINGAYNFCIVYHWNDFALLEEEGRNKSIHVKVASAKYLWFVCVEILETSWRKTNIIDVKSKPIRERRFLNSMLHGVLLDILLFLRNLLGNFQ